ncbi:hypothetical protein Rsub_05108 [Raphidocelis subcapitata]|uniref:Uncharacterized protein n=1 Tax=Raphidocelis subcapitata TaxID=307507 RepID=A0A2V0NZI9_9CHLO|nr:hypothetical protein Rsub_05108 [Raphidocelis subcapitata]|eukprot:GBF92739.1 hypothetical protein Rsub_05108 [Raphidocelis subcapitata]
MQPLKARHAAQSPPRRPPAAAGAGAEDCRAAPANQGAPPSGKQPPSMARRLRALLTSARASSGGGGSGSGSGGPHGERAPAAGAASSSSEGDTMRSAATARDQLQHGMGLQRNGSKPPSAPAWLRGSSSSSGSNLSSGGDRSRGGASSDAVESMGPLSAHLHRLNQQRASFSGSIRGDAPSSGPQAPPTAAPGAIHAGGAQWGSRASAWDGASTSAEVCMIGSVDDSFAAALSNLITDSAGAASPESCASVAVPVPAPPAVNRTSGGDGRGAAFQALLSVADVALQDSTARLALEEHKFAAAGALLRRTDSRALACGGPVGCVPSAACAPAMLQSVPEEGPAGLTPEAPPAQPPPAAPRRGGLPCAQGRPPLPHAAGLVARRLALAAGLGTPPPPGGVPLAAPPMPVAAAACGGPTAATMQRALLAAVANAHRHYGDSASDAATHSEIAVAASSASVSAAISACWAGAKATHGAVAASSTASSVNSWSPKADSGAAWFGARGASAALPPLDPGDRGSCTSISAGSAAPAFSGRAAAAAWGAAIGPSALQRAFLRGAAATRPGRAVAVRAGPECLGGIAYPAPLAGAAVPLAGQHSHLDCALLAAGAGQRLLPLFRTLPPASSPAAVFTPPAAAAAPHRAHQKYSQLQPTPLVTPPMQRGGSGGGGGGAPGQPAQTPDAAFEGPDGAGAADPPTVTASVGSCASVCCSRDGARARATSRRLFD